jgi:hypothetical protein
VSRRERIILLLDNYVDVVNGLRDRLGNGEHIPLMCRAFNHPSYRELERLRILMRDTEGGMYWHLTRTYFNGEKRRVLQCPRCQGTMPAWSSVNFHKHGRTNVAVVPRVLRVYPQGVRQARVNDAVAWLDEHWVGEPFIPDDLLAAAA